MFLVFEGIISEKEPGLNSLMKSDEIGARLLVSRIRETSNLAPIYYLLRLARQKSIIASKARWTDAGAPSWLANASMKARRSGAAGRFP